MKKKKISEKEESLTRQEENAFDGETAPGEETSSEEESLTLEGEILPSEEDELSALQASLEESEAKQKEYLDGWQRSRAEFANYKKRIVRERERANQTAKGKVIRGYLDILDDLERALNNRPQDGEGADWASGIALIYQKFQKKLEAEGVELMNAEGEKFDPNLHEALMQEENEEYESGCVIEVVQKGYYLGDRVLRPARVRVAA